MDIVYSKSRYLSRILYRIPDILQRMVYIWAEIWYNPVKSIKERNTLMKPYRSAEEIFPLLHGCCGTYRLDGVTGFSRFTAEQLRYYTERSQDDFVRSHAPAGIYLECITDAPEVSFTYRVYKEKGFYRTQSGFDIWENGVLTALCPADLTGSKAEVHYSRQQKEPSVIRITFPSGVIILPDSFSPGNAIPTEQKAEKILFYGDSLTQSAYMANPSLSWHVPVCQWMKAEGINRGIGSMIYDAASLPTDTDCLPGTIFVEYGGNDLYRIPDTDRALAQAEAYLQKLSRLYPSAETWVITPDLGPRMGGTAEKWVREDAYCAALAGIARSLGMTPLSGRDLIPPMPVLYFEDMTHFNEGGSAIFANHLLHAMGWERK